MTRINYKSDFDFMALISATASSGEPVEVGFPSYDWELIINTNCVSSQAFVASHINGVCNNCFDDNGQIHVVCKDHHLSIGKLQCEFRAHLPNENYAGGVQTIISKHHLDIELVAGNGDNGSDLLAQLQLPIVVIGDGGVNPSLYLTKVDASRLYQPKGDYATTSELNGKQDKLTSGDGIDITNNVITCTLDTSLYVVVSELPTEGLANKIYLIESNTQGEQNIYTEYAFVNNAWERLGEYRAEINLEPYALKSELPTMVSQLANDAEYVNAEALMNRALTYCDDIYEDEYYDPTTGEVKTEVLTNGQRRFRTPKFSTLGRFVATFKFNASTTGQLSVYAWTPKGGFNGGATVELTAGTTEKEWRLRPAEGEAMYAFDFITNDADKSSVNVDITYTYAQEGDVPTKTSQLTNDSNFATLSDIPATETYVLNFTIKDGVNTGEYSEEEYTALRQAIEAGKLIIIGGTVTRVTADSQAMAADYVVIRYSTPRISDDNTSVTISVYELKFGLLNSGDTEYSYSSKAIHKTLT